MPRSLIGWSSKPVMVSNSFRLSAIRFWWAGSVGDLRYCASAVPGTAMFVNVTLPFAYGCTYSADPHAAHALLTTASTAHAPIKRKLVLLFIGCPFWCRRTVAGRG